MSKFIALRSKCYSYEIFDIEACTIKNKGIQKAVIKQNMTFDQFYECIFKNKDNFQTVRSLNSKNHNMYVLKTKKLALSNFDSKRYICEDGINTKPFGWNNLKKLIEILIEKLG